MNPYELFETDGDLEANGIWISYGNGSFEICLARAGGRNVHYQKVFEDAVDPYRKPDGSLELDPDLDRKIMIEVTAKTLIKGWRSQDHGDGKIPGRDGAPMSFSVKNVVKLMTDLPNLYEDLIRKANNYATFRAKQVEAAAKN